jgi:hypothetical protein
MTHCFFPLQRLQTLLFIRLLRSETASNRCDTARRGGVGLHHLSLGQPVTSDATQVGTVLMQSERYIGIGTHGTIR